MRNKKLPGAASLRQKAEEQLQKKHSQNKTSHTSLNKNASGEADYLRLMHELEVYQIELEMQNEELMSAVEKANMALAKFTELYDFAPAGYFTLNHFGTICELNFSGAAMLGFDRAILIGTDFRQCFTRDSQLVFTKFFRKVFETKVKQVCEVMLAIGDNPPTYIHLEGTASKEEQICLISAIDITDSKRIENHIQKLSVLQAALNDPGTLSKKLKIITDGVVDIFDADFARIWFILPGDQCNLNCIHAHVQEGACHNHEQCLHLLTSSGRYTHLDGKVHSRVPFGCAEIGLIASGKASMYLTNDVANDPLINNQEWAKSLGLVSFAGFQLRPYHGETIGVLALFSKHKISFEEETLLKGFSNMVVTVIQSAQSEDALRESEFFFKESQHAAFIGSYKFDLIRGLWESSEVLNQIFGIDNIYKKSVQGWLDIAHPDDQPMMNRYLQEEIISKRKPFNKEYRIIRKSDNETRWVLGLGKLFFDAEGRIISMLGTIQDITERKQVEAALQQSEAHLRELNITKDKFFSIIAHDLRNPFSAIIGFSNLLVEQVQRKDYEGIEEFAGIIKNSSQRALGLLMNLMDWSRTQTGSMKFSPKPFEIITLITEAVELLKASALQKSIAINVNDLSNILVLADKAMISTILRNLISNAIKFTNPGGTIIISTEQKQNELIIAVADDGIGIKKEMIEKLFRIDENHSTEGTDNEVGTGLGLVLCQEFVKKHNGKIWVESEPLKGSTFYFTIPKS